MTRPEKKFTIRLNEKDRPFLDEEALRLMQEHFERSRELRRPSLADVVSMLLEELREHRRHANRCPLPRQSRRRGPRGLGPRGPDTEQLLRMLLDEVGAEEVLSAVLARLGEDASDVRPEPRRLTEEEREELRRYLRGQGLSKRTTYETLKCVRQLERPEDSNFSGPPPPPVPCRHPNEEDGLDRRAFKLDWWDGSGTNNRRKALRHVCQWQDVRVWASLEGRIPPTTKQKRPTPTREIVAS